MTTISKAITGERSAVKAARSVRRGPDEKGVAKPPRRLATRLIGKLPARMMPVFRQTIQQLLPFLGREGVRQIHIWGVCYPPALGELLWLCDQQNITLSTDSAGPTVNPCYGSWGYGSWRDNAYQRLPSSQRGAERTRHVRLTREWLADFRRLEAKHYRFVPIREAGARQLSWIESGQEEGAIASC